MKKGVKRTGTLIFQRFCQSITEAKEYRGSSQLDSIQILAFKENAIYSKNTITEEANNKKSGKSEKLEQNKELAKKRLNGKDVDFRDLSKENIEKIKMELKKAKKREK